MHSETRLLPGFARGPELSDREVELAFVYHTLFGGQCTCPNVRERELGMCPGCDLLVGRRRARLTAPETLVQHWARQPRLAFFLANDCWPGDAEQLKAALERGGRAELELHLRTLYYCLYLGNLEEYERTTRLPDYAPTALKEGLSVSCTFKALHGFDPSY